MIIFISVMVIIGIHWRNRRKVVKNRLRESMKVVMSNSVGLKLFYVLGR